MALHTTSEQGSHTLETGVTPLQISSPVPDDRDGKRVYLLTEGCYRIELDDERYRQYFEANGYRMTDQLGEADIVVGNFCSVNLEAEESALRAVQFLQERIKPSAKFIVGGCIGRISREALGRVHSGAVFSPDSLSELDHIVKPSVPIRQIPEVNTTFKRPKESEHSTQPSFKKQRLQPSLVKDYLRRHIAKMPRRKQQWNRRNRDLKRTGVIDYLGYKIPKLYKRKMEHASSRNAGTFALTVAHGCLLKCSYCAIRFARGRLQSRQPDEIIRELRAGIAAGHRSFKLISLDLGCYGMDIGTSLPNLLQGLARAAQATEGVRIVLPDVNPVFLCRYRNDELARITELIRRDGMIHWIDIPFQSASLKILKAMKRKYDPDRLLEIVRMFKRASPNLGVRCHVMVGFPGETDRDFRETADFFWKFPADDLMVFRYSDRENTSASELPDHIPDAEKDRRRDEIERIWRKKLLFQNSFGAVHRFFHNTAKAVGARGRDSVK